MFLRDYLDRFQLFEGNNMVYEGADPIYSFTAEIGTKYEFQARAVNRIGASNLSSIQAVYLPPPVAVKEIVGVGNYVDYRPR